MPEAFTLEEIALIEELQVFSLTLTRLRQAGEHPYVLMKLTSLCKRIYDEQDPLIRKLAAAEAAGQEKK